MALSITGSASQPWNLMPPRFMSMFCQPAFQTSQPHSAPITTYTAVPAQSMKRRMASMPCQNTKACSTHMAMKATQPSVDRPAKPCSFTSADGGRHVGAQHAEGGAADHRVRRARHLAGLGHQVAEELHDDDAHQQRHQ